MTDQEVKKYLESIGGLKSAYYPCKKDIFEETYETIE